MPTNVSDVGGHMMIVSQKSASSWLSLGLLCGPGYHGNTFGSRCLVTSRPFAELSCLNNSWLHHYRFRVVCTRSPIHADTLVSSSVLNICMITTTSSGPGVYSKYGRKSPVFLQVETLTNPPLSTPVVSVSRLFMVFVLCLCGLCRRSLHCR